MTPRIDHSERRAGVGRRREGEGVQFVVGEEEWVGTGCVGVEIEDMAGGEGAGEKKVEDVCEIESRE